MTVVGQDRAGTGLRSLGGRLVRDGRAVVLGCLAFYLLVVAASRALFRVDLWPALGVPAGPSLFFDARNVAAAVECSRLGHDPLVDNPCDPWGRAMFYPRVWLALRWTGLEQRHTMLFGVMIVSIFLLLFLLLLPRLSFKEGVIVAVAACSPAVMFAVERGNMDLVVFSGLAFAAVLWRRGSPAARYAAVGVVLLMAIAKLYPVVALFAFLAARSRRVAAAAVGGLAIFAAYVVATREDVATISRTATQGQHHSYGARILLGRLYHAVFGEEWGGSRALAQGLVLVTLMALGLGLLMWLPRLVRRSQAGTRMPETYALIAFRMGALVYLGTFVAGNSFDYRLVFLLLVLPTLLRWAGPAEQTQMDFAFATALVLVLALWIGAFSEQLRLWDELISWALAGMLFVLLVRSAAPLTAMLGPSRPRVP